MSLTKSVLVRPRQHQAGSAFILVLLALVVLTILGLGLALVTQTEYQLGANERSISRTFYASDSGPAVAATFVLVNHDRTPKVFMMNDGRTLGSGGKTRSQASTTPFAAVAAGPCNLCNVAGTSQSYRNGLYTASNVVSSYGAYVTTDNAGTATFQAQKSVFSWLDMQPISMTADDIKMSTFDAVQSQKVKF